VVNFQAPSIVRRLLTWLYWPVLGLGLIVTMGWVLGAIVGPRHALNAVGALASISFTGLVAWRLWLNKRSLGEGGPFPGPGTLLRVFLPLGVIALVGLLIVAVGITMIVVWSSVTLGEAPGVAVYEAPELSYFGLIGGAALLVGTGMCWPMFRRLVRGSVRGVNTESEDQHG